jgi:hypothetical protein
MRRRDKVFFAICSLTLLHAGPPFFTDDPEPVDFQHFEAYLFSTADATHFGQGYFGPAFEMNWGALPDTQLHIVIPAATFAPTGGPSAFGIGDIELGVKYRFIHETKRRPEFGIFLSSRRPAEASRRASATAAPGIACRCGCRSRRVPGPPTVAPASNSTPRPA